MDIRTVDGYKSKISRIDGLPYFLNNGAPRGAPLLFCLEMFLETKKKGLSCEIGHLHDDAI